MLLEMAIARGLAAGELGRVYRRWVTPRAKVGSRHRNPVGLLEVLAVTEVAGADLTDADAHASGHADLDSLLASLDGRPGRIFRVDLRFAGPDPRLALREDAELPAEALADLRRRLDRKDRPEPWTRPVLRLLAAHPGRRAAELAGSIGWDTPTFKRRVRGLKELGLTESLEVGYRLSPRGRALLAVEPEEEPACPTSST